MKNKMPSAELAEKVRQILLMRLDDDELKAAFAFIKAITEVNLELSAENMQMYSFILKLKRKAGPND